MIGVYGANGFVGRHVVRWLVEHQMPVKAVSRRLDKGFVREVGEAAEFVTADLGDPSAMAASLAGVRTVVQLISTSSPASGNERVVSDIEANVVPHVSFLRACVEAGVERYVFLSSGGTVYGPEAPVPTPETCPTNPISSHGLTKLILEKYIQMYGHVDGLEYFILRVSNLFGPGQEFRRGQGVFPMLLDRWREGREVKILGDGTACRDYVFIDDVVEAIGSALTYGGNPQFVLNIGSGETRTVNEVIEAIEAVAKYRFRREYIPARGTDVGVSQLDASLAGKVLGWRPMTGFHKAVTATVASAAEQKLLR